MEWTGTLKCAISYMEEHLLEDIHAGDVAEAVHISPFYLQKGFRIMTGYSIGEYLRYRRLYLAALEVLAGRSKVIDLAYKYGYDTPESFTKAFSRFHGVSPAQLKQDSWKITPFLPLKIIVKVQGGTDMDVTVEKMKRFQVIGFEREFSLEDSYEKIPEFWGEFRDAYLKPLWAKAKPETEMERVLCECCIGEYGICIDDLGKEGKFRYLIGGTYQGGLVPEGMTLYEFPDMEWAKFRCTGPMPGALQSVNTKVFREWLPGNEEYEIAMGANVEWYAKGDTSALDYESAIWVPVKRK